MLSLMILFNISLIASLAVSACARSYLCVNDCACTRETVTDGVTTTSNISVNCRGKNINSFPAERLSMDAWGASYIDLGDNSINALGDNMIDEQTELKKLILDNNYIEEIREAFFNVTGTYWSPRISPLEYVDLRDNHLHFVPSCFGRAHSSIASLDNLKTLLLGGNLYGNTLKLDSFINIWSVRELDISRSGIEVIPELLLKRLPHLEMLDLSYNALTRLSHTIFAQKVQLIVLNLQGNRLEGISPNLPITIKELRLGSNIIKNLTSSDVMAISRMKNLEILDLNKNRIEYLTYGLFASLSELVYLDLSENAIRSLQMNIFDGARKLEYIFLHKNPFLGYVADFAFASLPRLHYLFLHECGLRTLSLLVDEESSAVLSPPLRNIWLYGNPINCNCGLVQLVKFLKTKEIGLDSAFTSIVPNTGTSRVDVAVTDKIKRMRSKVIQTVCEGPLNRHHAVVGKLILEVPENYLTCPDEPIYIIVSVFLGIASFAVVIPIVFCMVGTYLLLLRLGRKHFGWKLDENEE